MILLVQPCMFCFASCHEVQVSSTGVNRSFNISPMERINTIYKNLCLRFCLLSLAQWLLEHLNLLDKVLWMICISTLYLQLQCNYWTPCIYLWCHSVIYDSIPSGCHPQFGERSVDYGQRHSWCQSHLAENHFTSLHIIQHQSIGWPIGTIQTPHWIRFG